MCASWQETVSPISWVYYQNVVRNNEIVSTSHTAVNLCITTIVSRFNEQSHVQTPPTLAERKRGLVTIRHLATYFKERHSQDDLPGILNYNTLFWNEGRHSLAPRPHPRGEKKGSGYNTTSRLTLDRKLGGAQERGQVKSVHQTRKV